MEQAVILPADVRAIDPHEHLAALFDAHESRLYRLARRLTTTIDDANDLVQETFLRAAKSLSRVPSGLAQEEAWLVRVLINIRRDQWRKAAVRQRSQVLLNGFDAQALNQESALVTKRAVWAALDILPPRRRAITVLHELEGLSLSDIAALLGVSVMTIRWHLSLARRELRRLLKNHLGGPE